jgi:zinc protease
MNFPRFSLVLLALWASSAFAGIADHVVRTRIAGVDVIAYPTAVKDVVTIYGSLPAGDAFAGEQHPDVATLTGMMLDKGTTTADKFAIAQQLESVGATISFSVGAQTLGVRAKCLRKDAPAILRLIVEQLRRPAFPVAEFEKAKMQLAGALQRSLEDTDSRAAETFARAVYPAGHPNRPASAGEMLAALGHTELADVQAFYARYYGPAHFTLVIVGDLDVPKIQSELRRDLSGWRGGVDAVRQAPAQAGGGAREEKVPMADKTSVSIVLGQASGLRYADADSIPLRVGAAVLGSGFTGRLMQIVRDKEGLTYGIGAYLDNDTFTDGDWRISGSFAPQLLDKGIASTRRELERWWRDGITAEELAARKTDLIGSYKVSLATTDGMASVMLRFIQRGKPLSWLDDYPKAIEAVTLDEVNGAIRKHLNPDKMTLVEAGTLPAAN